MRTSLALLCVLAVASFAAADPIVSMSYVNDGTPAGYTGMTRYLIYLDTVAGYDAKALDGRFDGPMHQASYKSPVPPGFDVYSTHDLTYQSTIDYFLPGAWAADSHMMSFYNNDGSGAQDATYGSTMSEDVSFMAGAAPGGAAEGIGQYIAGSGPKEGGPYDPATVGIMSVAWGNVHTDSLLVAQIVVPDGGTVTYSGNVAYAESGTEKRTQVPMTLVIPEPATLALMAIGGLALIRKRR